MKTIKHIASTFILACLSFSTLADPIQAQWQAHQIEFRYTSFTSLYTCSGIESKIRTIMKGIGAHEDIEVQASCSRGFNTPSEMTRIKMAFSMPVPSDETDITAETFKAEWQEFKMRNRRPRGLESGDCELVETLNREVFPQLSIRNVNDRTRCVPHNQNMHGINTTMTLLLPLEDQETVITKD